MQLIKIMSSPRTENGGHERKPEEERESYIEWL